MGMMLGDFGSSVTISMLDGMKTEVYRQIIKSLKGTGVNPYINGVVVWFLKVTIGNILAEITSS